jgi:hypothetical protein
VRGGAIPLLAWASLLVVLLAINWIWTGDAVQVSSFGFAALAVYTGGALLVVIGREALRRGPPPAARDPEAIPQESLAAVIVGLSIACILFGIVWATFLVYFGAGVLVLSLGRVAIELYSERASRRRYSRERSP